MIFLRGSVEDFDGWTSLGNDGWTWDDMLPYYKKSENFTAPDAGFAAAGNISWEEAVMGSGGPVQTTFPNYFFPGSANWWDATQESDIAISPDPNSGASSGVFWLRLAEDAQTRTRSYARIVHYDRVASQRPNYHILTETKVAKVLLKDKQAVGVEYLPYAGGNTTAVYASKEVLVAAGGLHTPQILQLSGIGPKPLLDSFGIEVVSELPGVGQNFQDQATIDVTYNFTNNVEPNWDTLQNNATYDAEQRALYDTDHTGPYTIIRTLSTNFASIPLKNLTSSYLDIVAAARARDPAAYLPTDTDPTVLAGYSAQREILLNQLTEDVGVGGLAWGTAGQSTLYSFKPFSRGTVNINSTDPLAAPIVDFRTATDPTDLDVAVAIIRKHREIMSAPSMAILGPVELSPFGADVQTDDEIKTAIRQAMNPTAAHECGTAAMMPLELGGVIDDQMRVYGVDGLRVIDVSYFPMSITGAPSSTVYATGEKIADVIKEKWNLGNN